MKTVTENLGAWLRGMVWTAMVAGCAWASAQSYLVTSPEGSYRLEAAAHAYTLMSHEGRSYEVAMGQGEGVGLGQGIGAEGGAQNAQPLPKDDLFAGTEVFAKGASDITEITMDPDSLDLVGGRDEHRARTMVLNVVRTYTYDKPGMYNMADVDAIRNKLNTGDWHCSVHVRDLKNGSGSDVCGKRRTDGMRETAIIEVSPKQLTFIHTIRKANGPGSSELGYFPMLPGLSPMTMIAMTNPEALADMQFGLHGMPFVYANPDVHVFVRNFSSDFRDFNSPEMKQKMDELQKKMQDLKMHPPVDEKKMEDLQKQMKELNKDFSKDRTAPIAPSAPVPATPQAAPAPVTPQPPQ